MTRVVRRGLEMAKAGLPECSFQRLPSDAQDKAPKGAFCMFGVEKDAPRPSMVFIVGQSRRVLRPAASQDNANLQFARKPRGLPGAA